MEMPFYATNYINKYNRNKISFNYTVGTKFS